MFGLLKSVEYHVNLWCILRVGLPWLAELTEILRVLVNWGVSGVVPPTMAKTCIRNELQEACFAY